MRRLVIAVGGTVAVAGSVWLVLFRAEPRQTPESPTVSEESSAGAEPLPATGEPLEIERPVVDEVAPRQADAAEQARRLQVYAERLERSSTAVKQLQARLGEANAGERAVGQAELVQRRIERRKAELGAR